MRGLDLTREDKSHQTEHKEQPDNKTEEETNLLGELSHLILVDLLPFNELRGKILRYQVLHYYRLTVLPLDQILERNKHRRYIRSIFTVAEHRVIF